MVEAEAAAEEGAAELEPEAAAEREPEAAAEREPAAGQEAVAQGPAAEPELEAVAQEAEARAAVGRESFARMSNKKT